MQIIPIKDLRDTNKVSDMCKETKEPIFITKNGYGDMVIINIKIYEEKLEMIEMHEGILEGIKGVEEGRVLDGPKALREIREKYGLWLWNNGKVK